MDHEFWGRGCDLEKLRSGSEEDHGGLKVGRKGRRMPVYQVSSWHLDMGSSPASSSPNAELTQLLI